MKEQIEAIADHYGYDSQSRQLIEEIADVELMIEQIKYLMDCEIDVEETKERKIKRQLARIEKEDITQ